MKEGTLETKIFKSTFTTNFETKVDAVQSITRRLSKSYVTGSIDFNFALAQPRLGNDPALAHRRDVLLAVAKEMFQRRLVEVLHAHGGVLPAGSTYIYPPLYTRRLLIGFQVRVYPPLYTRHVLIRFRVEVSVCVRVHVEVHHTRWGGAS